MNTHVDLTFAQKQALIMRGRQLQAEAMVKLAKTAGRGLKRMFAAPAAEPRVLAKCAIAPIMPGHRHNRSSVNPLMMRGLGLS